MKYQGRTNEYFEVLDITQNNCNRLKEIDDEQLSLLWFVADDNKLVVDAIEHHWNTNQVVCLTEFHHLEPKQITGLKLLRFNRPFYCIANHDSEVGCKGILYFGASNLPVIDIPDIEAEILATAWKMLCLEMEAQDNLQLEMLQMMLKRILILCTRIYKKQNNYESMDASKIDLIKQFNFLVEQHFKDKHTVSEYADLLNKSPKTLSNLFKKIGNKTPLELIQQRRMLEARRLLTYTNEPVSEIGYQIGFNDIQSFSRFFKKQEGTSPSDFRNFQLTGKN